MSVMSRCRSTHLPFSIRCQKDRVRRGSLWHESAKRIGPEATRRTKGGMSIPIIITGIVFVSWKEYMCC